MTDFLYWHVAPVVMIVTLLVVAIIVFIGARRG